VLGRIVNAWLHDPTASYVALAVAFSGLTTFVVYYLALAVYDRTTALAAAALLAVSPLFWFYGSVGLTYAGEALFASTVAYFGFARSTVAAATRTWPRGTSASRAACASRCSSCCSRSGSAAWRSACAGSRACLIGLGILTASVLTWFVPMIWLTGGLERYIAASVELADSVVKPTSIVGGPFDVTLRMSRYLLESVLVALGPLAAASLLAVWYVGAGAGPSGSGSCSRGRFPPVLVYTLVHFRPGRLRADVPAGAGDLPLARAGHGPGAGG
jgi:asparagine N-glycosylation enzyme membrane subunit Stt3